MLGSPRLSVQPGTRTLFSFSLKTKSVRTEYLRDTRRTLLDWTLYYWYRAWARSCGGRCSLGGRAGERAGVALISTDLNRSRSVRPHPRRHARFVKKRKSDREKETTRPPRGPNRTRISLLSRRLSYDHAAERPEAMRQPSPSSVIRSGTGHCVEEDAEPQPNHRHQLRRHRPQLVANLHRRHVPHRLLHGRAWS